MKKLASLAAAALIAAVAAPSAAHAATPNLDTSKTYRISTPWSLVLDIPGGSKGDGTALTEWPVNGGTNQQWRLDYLDSPAGNHYRIRNVNSNKCVTSPGGSVAPRTKI